MGPAVGRGALEAVQLGVGGIEADLESFDFTEPAIGAGLTDALAEVLDDLDEPGSLAWVDLEDGAANACVRCPMLWPDPAQRDRLVEIRDNLLARVVEAEREGWLGEVEGLQISLAGAEDKLAQMDRRASDGTAINLAMPGIAAAQPMREGGTALLRQSLDDQQ